MGCTGVPDKIEPIDDFTLSRYLGQWYEIARYDHSFEAGLSNVTANYALRDDGGISVVNKGYNSETKEWDEAFGKAYFVGEESVGHLKVSFFGPFYASYVIFALDKSEYKYALVTGPSRDYFWILARQPIISSEESMALLSIAKAHGYQEEKLIWVQHDGT